MKIAVVGSGISGMGCAWVLAQRHDVTLYEAESRLGGHTNTLSVPTANGSIPVDTGFIVYNERNYPNLTHLFRALGVATQASTMSFAVSLDRGALEYSGSLTGLFGQRRNLVSPRFYRMLAEIMRFYRTAPGLLHADYDTELSLGTYLRRENYSDDFIYDHLLPMGAAIWSCPIEEMMGFPVASFVRFCVNHGLLQIRNRPAWRTVVGGSNSYIDKITAPYRDRIRRATPVVAVEPTAEGRIRVSDGRGGTDTFDHVIFACHGDQAATILGQTYREQATALAPFTFQPNRAFLHRDLGLMPKRRAVWSSWNYLATRGDLKTISVTYWMNKLQNLPTETGDVFVTLNPPTPPNPNTVIATIDYRHPVFDAGAIGAQKRLTDIQGKNGLWFCGAWCGWGFHEDGLSAGLAVARAIGVDAPWPAAEAHAAAAVWPLTTPLPGRFAQGHRP